MPLWALQSVQSSYLQSSYLVFIALAGEMEIIIFIVVSGIFARLHMAEFCFIEQYLLVLEIIA